MDYLDPDERRRRARKVLKTLMLRLGGPDPVARGLERAQIPVVEEPIRTYLLAELEILRHRVAR